MEIRAGTGGDEAALFARDLYEMYRHYCEDKGWKVEVLDMSATELGGFKEVILGVEGEGVLPRAAVRKRRASRAARAGDRAEGAHSHVGRDGRRTARAGRRGNRHQARRLSQGPVLRQRPRRAAREQDAVGRAAHALRERHRRAVPGRKEPAQELRPGAARAQDAALRTQAAARAGRSGRASGRRWSARAIAASGFAPTTSRRTA